MRLKLGARLETVLSLLEGGVKAVDVGTDHGLLPVAALLTGRASAAIATDISGKSLAKARILAEKEGVPLDCREGDGLAPLREGEAEVVVIAGMGGLEIVRILSESPVSVPRGIFVPHTHAKDVRAYLKERNALILRDIAVKEGDHFYFVIEADFTSPWQAHSLYFGREGKDFAAYREARLEKLDRLLAVRRDSSLEEEKEELANADRA